MRIGVKKLRVSPAMILAIKAKETLTLLKNWKYGILISVSLPCFPSIKSKSVLEGTKHTEITPVQSMNPAKINSMPIYPKLLYNNAASMGPIVIPAPMAIFQKP